jgi:hypothetical protein
MSKSYRVAMDIDISAVSPASGFLMKSVDRAIDESGFTPRCAYEVFAFLCDVAIQGAYPKVSYGELKTHRRIIKALNEAKKEYIANKSDIEVIKTAIQKNKNWPNSDEMFDILDQIMAKLHGAEEINENPTPSS